MSKIGVLFRTMAPSLRYLFIAVAFLGLTAGMYETVFNNYLDDVFSISAKTRGVLEFPRELPGFLVAVFSGALFFLVEARLAIFCVIAISLGLLGMGFLSPSFGMMIVWMMLWSSGTHLFMPLEQTLAITAAKPGREGERLGQIAGVRAAATIVGAAIVWWGTDYIKLSYSALFLIAAVSAVLAAITLTFIKTPARSVNEPPRVRFVFRSKYWLYYVLAVLYGARKQIFLTFAPWVLVRLFGEPASTIAKLWIVSSIVGIAFRPYIGRLIDRIGERAILMMESVLVILICLGYAFGPELGMGPWGLRIVYLCFVIDQSLFAVGVARTTYLYKISESRSDLTPTLSMGVSLDHAVSMSIPMLGGLVWALFGHSMVFLGAAVIAFVNLFMASMVRISERVAVGQGQTM